MKAIDWSLFKQQKAYLVELAADGKHNTDLLDGVIHLMDAMQDDKEEIYCVEWNGEVYQSVFPSAESHLSQLHTSTEDALSYFAEVKPGVVPEILIL